MGNGMCKVGEVPGSACVQRSAREGSEEGLGAEAVQENQRSPITPCPGAVGSVVRLDGFPPSLDCEPATSWSPT